jgi:signal transduction histidine kinase
MRERITAAFVLLAVAVLIGAGTVRAFTLRDLLREQDAAHLQDHVALVARLVAGREDAGDPVNAQFLATVVPDDARLRYTPPTGEPPVEVSGPDHDAEPSRTVSASQRGEFGAVRLSRPGPQLADVVVRDVAALVTLFLLIAILAAFAGWLAAQALSRPFQKLAVAARALGRGRFDLDLPRTRIPEAEAIAQSLRASALQLESRLQRERDFAAHASHELRTPLTALRLELEDLTTRPDVPDDVKQAADRCIRSVDGVNTSAGELVALARRSALVEGAELTLRDMATQLAQRWADRLADQRRKLSASAEGDLQAKFTPGPVEQVLDLLLSDIVLAGNGPVAITFVGAGDHLEVQIPAGAIGQPSRRGPQPGAGLAEARAVAEAHGGRVSGDGVVDDLEVLLPRR